MADRQQPTPLHLDRRAFLLASAGAVALTACGSGGDQVTAPSVDATMFLVNRTPPRQYAVAGYEQRFVLSVLDGKGSPPAEMPTELTVTVGPQGGSTETVTTTLHDEGIPAPYYPVRYTPTTAGPYDLATTIGGEDTSAQFLVQSPQDVAGLPQRTQPMPVLDTPTVADHRGVEPICTAVPECPLHDVNLRDALTTGTPTALLVSTPAYCQIAVCGPVLDLVLEARGTRPDITFIHAEVYADAAAVGGDIAEAEPAPIVTELGLGFEPILFLIDAAGTVTERLEIVFDRGELAEVLDAFAVAGP